MKFKKKDDLDKALDSINKGTPLFDVTFSDVRCDENEGVNKVEHTSFLGKQTIPKVIQDSSSTLTPPNPNERVIPSWYMFFKRSHLKKDLIRQRMDDYCRVTRVGTEEYQPSSDEIKDYAKKLKNLTLKELLLMGDLKKYDLKLDVLDRLKSIKKKKHAVVTIFNDNKTTDTGVIHCYDRTFTRHKMNYLVMSERGIYDPEFRMMHFYYFANNPFPLKLDKYPLDADIMDASLQDSVIEAKVIEALANIDMDKKINMILIIAIFMFIELTILLLVCLRGFKII